MTRVLMMAALAALVFGAEAQADDVVDSLKAPAVEACKKDVGTEMPDADKLCACLVDSIVTEFGDDAATMLKIVTAGFQPDDSAEIAKLMGVSEDEAKTFISAAEEKMDAAQQACIPK
jgi:hypothetical protein